MGGLLLHPVARYLVYKIQKMEYIFQFRVNVSSYKMIYFIPFNVSHEKGVPSGTK